LLRWDDLPAWAKDNEYIHTGFRPFTRSYLECFMSCFYIHNETGNIYSHLLATLWMIALPVMYYTYAKEHYPEANIDDWIVFGLFFLGGALCFGLSTAYHVVSNHSHAVHDVYLRLDLLGISTVTAGCFPPGVWYTLACVSRNTKIFWIIVREKHLEKSQRLEPSADIDQLGQSRCSADGSYLRSLRSTLPSTCMASSLRLPLLIHGFFCVLSHHLCRFSERV
jgi:hypothetical protein